MRSGSDDVKWNLFWGAGLSQSQFAFSVEQVFLFPSLETHARRLWWNKKLTMAASEGEREMRFNFSFQFHPLRSHQPEHTTHSLSTNLACLEGVGVHSQRIFPAISCVSEFTIRPDNWLIKECGWEKVQHSGEKKKKVRPSSPKMSPDVVALLKGRDFFN